MFPVLLTYVRTYSNPRNGYRGIDPLGREVDSGLIFPLYICIEAYQGGYQTPYFGQECIIFFNFLRFVITHMGSYNSRDRDKCGAEPNVYLIRGNTGETAESLY